MKKMLFPFLALLLFSFSSVQAQDKSAYALYNKKGKSVKYKKMLNALKDAELVFFGEEHNNPIAHWLQLELTQDLQEQRGKNLILGAEMFETDNQILLDEYLTGMITEKSFLEEARLWPNYATDYKPLVEFAKTHQLDFVATNIPRRYASLIYKKGINQLDSLSDEAKTLFAPLPIAIDLSLPGYQKMLEMMGGHNDELSLNFPTAQAMKDATMGYFISQKLSDTSLFLHYNGSYHSDNYEGINWYIEKYRPSTKIITITTVSQADISKLSEEHLEKADFIICVPENMTKTY